MPRRAHVLRMAALCLALVPGLGWSQESSPSLDGEASPDRPLPEAPGDAPGITKIMPLGASNTYGMYENPASRGGYRGPLYDLLSAEGAHFDFVGLDNDGDIPDADHNGYPGKPIGWFTAPVNEAVNEEGLDYTIDSSGKPVVVHFLEQAQMTPNDVVLLLLGTNNVRLGDSAETMLAEMRLLLDQIVQSEASPKVQMMMLTPIGGDYWEDADPTRTNNDTIRLFNQSLKALVAGTYGDLGVTLIDSATTAEDRASDGVHLNEAGYRKVADAFFAGLTEIGGVTKEAATEGLSAAAAESP